MGCGPLGKTVHSIEIGKVTLRWHALSLWDTTSSRACTCSLTCSCAPLSPSRKVGAVLLHCTSSLIRYQHSVHNWSDGVWGGRQNWASRRPFWTTWSDTVATDRCLWAMTGPTQTATQGEHINATHWPQQAPIPYHILFTLSRGLGCVEVTIEPFGQAWFRPKPSSSGEPQIWTWKYAIRRGVNGSSGPPEFGGYLACCTRNTEIRCTPALPASLMLPCQTWELLCGPTQRTEFGLLNQLNAPQVPRPILIPSPILPLGLTPIPGQNPS
mmetsp:Transcript_116963/g.203597  ORF Transcript_116963/g.203597 Transcript_116963/m.203597 type:complete len:269 (+) Transcript_116963:78-884(+)